jgi:type III restriction enzyme
MIEKIYQQNGALESFRTMVEPDLILAETDETALINIIRTLNPVVIVDESPQCRKYLKC